MSEQTDVSNLSLEEKKKLLALRLKEKKEVLLSKDITKLLDFQVKYKSDKTAIIENAIEYSYGDLDKKINQMMRFLNEHNVRKGSHLALSLSSLVNQTCLFIAAIKNGAVVSTVNSSFSDQYISYIIHKHNITHLCIDTGKSFESDGECKSIALSAENPWESLSSDYVDSALSSDEIVYKCFTGNSMAPLTGSALCSMVTSLQETIKGFNGARVSTYDTIDTYISVIQTMSTLTSGGTIVAPHDESDYEYLFIDGYSLHRVSETGITTSNSIKEIIVMGAPISKATIESKAAQLGKPIRYIFSPPHSGMLVSSFSSEDDTVSDEYIIGKEFGNNILILNNSLGMVPTGVKGAIYICGLDKSLIEAQKGMTVVKSDTSDLPHEWLLAAGFTGHKLSDGSIAVSHQKRRYVSLSGYYISLAALEQMVMEQSTSGHLFECYIISNESEKQTLLAYMVIDNIKNVSHVEKELKNILPDFLVPQCIPVTHIPLDDAGVVDEDLLMKTPVIHSDLIVDLQTKIKTSNAVDDISFLTKEKEETVSYVHLSDAITDFKTPGVSNDTEKTPGTDSELKQESSSGTSESTELSIREGKEFSFQENINTLQDVIEHTASKYSNNKIICLLPDDAEIILTYSELYSKAKQVLAGLRKQGVEPGDKVIFQYERNDMFIITFWGSILGGFIPVPIAKAHSYSAPNSNLSKLVNACEMFDSYLVVTEERFIEEMNMLINDSKSASQLKNFKSATFETLMDSEPDPDIHQSNPDDMAVIMLTSGSTGKPKGVMQQHQSLIARSKATIEHNGHGESDVSLNWMPLDHVGGIVMFHLRDVYCGCDQIQVPTNNILANPLKWLDLLDTFKATITWAPNFAYGLINDKAKEVEAGSWDLSSVRFILNGGEAVVPKTTRRFLMLLKQHSLSETSMFPAWGMSETCSGVVYNQFALGSTSDDDPFTVVGDPIPGFKMRIVDEKGEIVNEGVIGALHVSGPSVTMGYFDNPEVNAESFSDDGWLIVGDLGFIKNGKLTITGRMKDVIIINGINYHGHEIETTVEEIESVEVSYTAACAVRDTHTDTDRLAIFFNTEIEKDTSEGREALLKLIKTIKSEVVKQIGVNADYIIPVEKSDIPKTEIGKIQRTKLTEQFADGVFEPIVKELDLHMKNENTLPEWFFERQWVSKELYSDSITPYGKNILIFAEESGLSNNIYETLKENNTCIIIQRGNSYSKKDSFHFEISNESSSDYDSMIADILSTHKQIDYVIHFWAYKPLDNEIIENGDIFSYQKNILHSITFLTQALHKNQGDNSIDLHIVSSHAQFLSKKENCKYAHGTITGFLKSLNTELPWTRARHIDLSYGYTQNKNHILQEIGLSKIDEEVAYREGDRYVPILHETQLESLKNPIDSIKTNGVYVITGGLGGIGTLLAKFLIQRYQAKLILIGRTELPERQNWSNILKENNLEDKKTIDRINNFSDIEKDGGDVLYVTADINNKASIETAITKGEKEWEKNVDGIFHLAGEGDLEEHWKVADQRMLLNETGDTFKKMFLAKVNGTINILDIIKERSGVLFVGFSSIMSIFGGSTFSAYSAANSCQESVIHHYKVTHGVHAYCMSWSLWDEIGMTSHNLQSSQATSEAMGYMTIGHTQGMFSLLASLHNGLSSVYIGLNQTMPHIQKYIQNNKTIAQELIGFYSGPEINSTVTLQDSFGNDIEYSINRVDSIPKDETGVVDWDVLRTLSAEMSGSDDEYIAPRNDIEEMLLAIFKDVLNVTKKISVTDNFFDLGANSILLVKVHTMIQSKGYELQIVDLFNYTTIEKLADFISSQQGEDKSESKGQEAESIAGDRKAMMQRRRQRKR